MKSKRAFTLMEMLVVIAIIGIFAALLFPAINTGRVKAQRVLCLNNLKQINVAVRLYADELNDATLSPGVAVTSTNHLPLYSGTRIW